MRRLSVAAPNRMAARSEYGRARVLRQRSPGRDGYGHRHDVRFSNRPVWVKRFQTIHWSVSMSLTGSCFSSESAPGPFHHGVRERGGTIYWAALPSIGGRSKQTYDLTSSIVPRGTSFHRAVELEFLLFNGVWLSCCHGFFPAPAERGAVDPDTVHDYGQPTRQRHDCLLHAAAPGDLHRPGLEPGPSC